MEPPPSIPKAGNPKMSSVHVDSSNLAALDFVQLSPLVLLQILII